MTTVDRRAANLKKLREAEDLQEKTKDSLMRSQRMAEEAEGLGAQTLDELRRQGEQMVINCAQTEGNLNKLVTDVYYIFCSE